MSTTPSPASNPAAPDSSAVGSAAIPVSNEVAGESSATKPVSFAEAAQEEQPGFFREFAEFLMESKAWWLTPIIVVLLLLGVLVWFAGSAVAPFIYTLF